MKKCRILAAFATMMLGVTIIGCNHARTNGEEEVEADSVETDSQNAADMQLSEEEELIAETPMPTAADEFFDDFFFNFAANPKLQFERVKFPLPVISGEQTHLMEKKAWKMDNFFMRQGYYTEIFDNQRQMDLSKDPSVDHVVLERIHLRSGRIQGYVFERQSGRWMLTEIRNEHFETNANASFLSFYERFVTDSAFQIQSLDDLVTFSSPNPDDDFETQTGEIVPEQWPMFKPDLIPGGTIYNLIYGGEVVEGSNQKIFMIRGIANGMESEMVFRKKGGKWRLVRFGS